MTTVAVIDTGTNSTRLLIAEVAGNSLIELCRRTAVTRLGEGVDKTGRLSQTAKERVSACIAEYAGDIAVIGAARTVILATSSIRDAADGGEFLEKQARKHGMDFRILSGDEEAALSFGGAAGGYQGAGRLLLLDIGGGSTEVAAGNGMRPDYSRSLDIGCVRVTERFIHHDPPQPEEIDGAAGFIDSLLSKGLDRRRIGSIDRALAVAGTVTSLAAVDLKLKTYQRQAVDGHVLARSRIDGLLTRLAKMSAAERSAIDTVEAGREDVIVAGAVIVSRLMRFLGIEELTVSEKDILNGAARWLASGDPDPR